MERDAAVSDRGLEGRRGRKVETRHEEGPDVCRVSMICPYWVIYLSLSSAAFQWIFLK
jgi:hypothetical protein